jgi:predicted lysophospholipase L1 biosynthesis ABC-type transport system permease subunit
VMMLIVALLSVVIGICLTAGFPDILLMLVAAVLPPFPLLFRCWGGVDELGAVESDFFVLYIHCHQ